jgi:hypothetical protein
MTGTRHHVPIALAVMAAALPGCGSGRPPILDTERVERAIQDSIYAKRHLRATVSCPSGTPRKKGHVFRCLATYRGGQTPFVVTEDNDRGAVHYVGVRR